MAKGARFSRANRTPSKSSLTMVNRVVNMVNWGEDPRCPTAWLAPLLVATLGHYCTITPLDWGVMFTLFTTLHQPVHQTTSLHSNALRRLVNMVMTLSQKLRGKNKFYKKFSGAFD